MPRTPLCTNHGIRLPLSLARTPVNHLYSLFVCCVTADAEVLELLFGCEQLSEWGAAPQPPPPIAAEPVPVRGGAPRMFASQPCQRPVQLQPPPQQHQWAQAAMAEAPAAAPAAPPPTATSATGSWTAAPLASSRNASVPPSGSMAGSDRPALHNVSNTAGGWGTGDADACEAPQAGGAGGAAASSSYGHVQKKQRVWREDQPATSSWSATLHSTSASTAPAPSPMETATVAPRVAQAAWPQPQPEAHMREQRQPLMASTGGRASLWSAAQPAQQQPQQPPELQPPAKSAATSGSASLWSAAPQPPATLPQGSAPASAPFKAPRSAAPSAAAAAPVLLRRISGSAAPPVQLSSSADAGGKDGRAAGAALALPLRFPAAGEPPPARTVAIPTAFPNAAAYKAKMVEAIAEELNLRIAEAARAFHAAAGRALGSTPGGAASVAPDRLSDAQTRALEAACNSARLPYHRATMTNFSFRFVICGLWFVQLLVLCCLSLMSSAVLLSQGLLLVPFTAGLPE